MKTFVILQAPNEGYYWLILGGSDKHFELEDKGFAEIDSGSYQEMLEKITYLEWDKATCGGHYTCITLKRKGQYSFMWHTDAELNRILDINPNFLDEWDIVDEHDWFGK